MKNNFKKIYNQCYAAGLRVIASKYGKKTGFKNWNEFKTRNPSDTEIQTWLNMEETNVDLMTGEASGVIALDFDCVDPEIIALIEHLLPESPSAKVGSKGWTRFFKYHPSFSESQMIKCNGQVVLEILSNNKKTTIPPSRHDNGMDYVWKGKALYNAVEELPLLPPLFLENIRSALAAHTNSYRLADKSKSGVLHIESGRNNVLSAIAMQLIEDNIPMDVALLRLIEEDKKHDNPLFMDRYEFNGVSEPYTNALGFYSRHLTSFNERCNRENKNPVIPQLGAVVEKQALEIVEAGKSQAAVKEKSEPSSLLAAVDTALGKLQRTILKNSYIEQPAFAVSASLALFSTLISRKLQFENTSPNLYLLNIASSGAGKDAPQQIIKRLMTATNCENLLGAGDYVSDASLTDELPRNPVRLDLMDEVSKLFGGVNKGDAAYNRKMGELYCELFSCSNDRFLGRMTAEGRKGACNRPNVNILGSTTPAAFSRSVNRYSIENGLLGRFLIFYGENNKRAQRLKGSLQFDESLLKHVSYWSAYNPESRITMTGQSTSQKVETIDATPEGHAALNKYFNQLEDEKLASDEDDIARPIIRRLYQMLVKIALVHACGRQKENVMVDCVDVEYAYKIVEFHRNRLEEVLTSNIYESKHERNYMNLLKKIPYQGIEKKELNKKTLSIPSKYRDSLLTELNFNGDITLQADKLPSGTYREIIKRIK